MSDMGIMNDPFLSDPFFSDVNAVDPFFVPRHHHHLLTDESHPRSQRKQQRGQLTQGGASSAAQQQGQQGQQGGGQQGQLGQQGQESTALQTQQQGGGGQLSAWGSGGRMWPLGVDMRVDVHEEKDKFVIKAELPGIPKENVKVNVDNGYLSISGEKKEEFSNEDKDRQVRRSERRFGKFQRSFRLPDNVNQENMNARYEQGVLTLDIPKTEVKPDTKREIQIQ